jgi:hypothetical protein
MEIIRRKLPANEIIALNNRLERIQNDYLETPEFSALRSVAVPTRYYHDFSMVQLRKEATDMIAADALGLSYTTLESLVIPIKEEGVTLTYGDSNIGYRNIPDNTLTRLAVTAEIIRRMEVRSGTDEEPYPEESCTAFSIGAYCMANGYPPLIQNDYDRSNLIGETPILIKQMNKLLDTDTYRHTVGLFLDKAATDVAPRHVDHAIVTRNGRPRLIFSPTLKSRSRARSFCKKHEIAVSRALRTFSSASLAAIGISTA